MPCCTECAWERLSTLCVYVGVGGGHMCVCVSKLFTFQAGPNRERK